MEYLSAQLWQLPIMQRALEESEASGHTCGGDHCTIPGCARGQEDKDEQQGGPVRSGFSDGDEQQQLAMMLQSIT